MKIHLGSMAPTVMACALLTAVAVPLATATTLPDCAGHMQAADPTQVCYDKFLAHSQDARTDSLALAAVGAASVGRTCYRPDAMPAGMIPTWAVMRRTDGTVVGEKFDAAWAEAKAGTAWTITVCA